TARSVLASVQQFGRDSSVAVDGTVTGGTSLPATSFTYAAAGSGGSTSVTWPSNTGATSGKGANWVAGDFNGDGRTEWALIGVGNNRCQVDIRKSDGTNLSD